MRGGCIQVDGCAHSWSRARKRRAAASTQRSGGENRSTRPSICPCVSVDAKTHGRGAPNVAIQAQQRCVSVDQQLPSKSMLLESESLVPVILAIAPVLVFSLFSDPSRFMSETICCPELVPLFPRSHSRQAREAMEETGGTARHSSRAHTARAAERIECYSHWATTVISAASEQQVRAEKQHSGATCVFALAWLH